MKILHYSLGFPPYRSGGLTKYCLDLMLSQKEQGHNVSMLWPGTIKLFSKRVSIKKHRNYDGITNYELINPLPVPLDEGVNRIDLFLKRYNESEFEMFLSDINPDIIHIHTLMGLPREVIAVANRLKIKTVFTTHDFFGICPKVTLFKNGEPCIDDHCGNDCVVCNRNALSYFKIVILQSSIYRFVKDAKIVKYLRVKHKNQYYDIDSSKNESCICEDNDNSKLRADEYMSLRKYYLDILERVDTIHYNSSLTERVYKRYFNSTNGKCINISHRQIIDMRKQKLFHPRNVRLTFLGTPKPLKGFNVLEKVLDDLWNYGYRNFTLNLFGVMDNKKEYMNIRNNYQYCDLEEIFDNTDVLIALSVGYETFGFTVLEALSYGVPIIISDTVGAKDLVKDEFGWVIQPNYESIKELLIQIFDNPLLLKICNDAICNTKIQLNNNATYITETLYN